MVWTSGHDPANERRDALRLLVGDMDPDEHLLEDAEIDYYLSLSDSDYVVASRLCIALAGIMARSVGTQVGPLREEAQQKFDHYVLLGRMYYDLGQGGGPGVPGFGTAVPILSADVDLEAFFTRCYPQ